VPILHIQYSATIPDANGNQVDAPPSVALAMHGPRVQITLGLAQVMIEQLAQQGQPTPVPISGWALIDSGASHTCIDDAAARTLGLPAIDRVRMASASHDRHEASRYPANITLPATGVALDTIAIGAALQVQGILALIGRDFLQHCTLFYNGIYGQITLSAL
jgi:hypothetical protein